MRCQETDLREDRVEVAKTMREPTWQSAADLDTFLGPG